MTEDMPRLPGFWGYFIRSYRVTFLIIIGVAILGSWTAATLPRESTPEVDIPFAVVITIYPGASSRDVEELVTKPIEEDLVNLAGVKRLDSSSQAGLSTVSVEFLAEEDLEDAIRRLREHVDGVRNLPEEVERPEVMEISFEDEPIISLSLGGIADERLLTFYAEDLATEIEGVQGVSQVNVAGGREEEIKVSIDPVKLAEKGVSIGQIFGAIRSANLNAPFGQLEAGKFNYDLRVTGRFDGPGDIAEIPLVTPTGQTVRLGGLARVEMGLSDRTTFSRIVTREQTSPAVTLSVRKKTGEAITDVIERVDEKVAAYQDLHLPQEVTIVAFADRAEDIRRSLSDVVGSGIQTFIIVFAVMWLFLGWRSAMIAAFAIPLTFAMAFVAFDMTDLTLNGISLFSLIISLGMLVDTTIVIVEGIHRHEREPIEQLEASAHRIVRQFSKPLIGGTMTTVAAFVPMLLVTGIIGEFLKVIPIVITASLLSSQFVSLALIPAVAVRFLSTWRPKEAKQRWFDEKYQRLRKTYHDQIAWLLERRRTQNIFIAILTVLLAVGLSLPFTGLLRTGLFPSVNIDFLIINVELPPGSRLAETEKAAEAVEGVLREVPEVVDLVTNVGSGVSLDFSGGGGGSESLASFYVNLDKERERSSQDITNELREKFKQVEGAKIVVEEISAGPPSAAPIEARIIGEDLVGLDEWSQRVMDELAQIPGAIEIDRNLRYSAGEFNFIFSREELAKAGLSLADMAQLLRTSVFGVEATTFLDERGDKVSVNLAAMEETINSVDDVLAMPVVTPAGGTMKLGQLAQVEAGSSLNAIRRRDGNRAVAVTARAAAGTTPNEITQELMVKMKEQELPEGLAIEYGGEQQETEETFAQLYRTMIIAVILIVIILVIEFNSYRQPLLIFLSIPLGLIGVLFGLLIFRGQLNFAAFIGLVSLTGIVVNNAILLVDRMNVLVARGKELKEAVIEAASNRLRPIILTTVTTAAGVAPLIWVDEFFRDMALTLITGLLFSTVITLALIPVLYYRQQLKIAAKKASV